MSGGWAGDENERRCPTGCLVDGADLYSLYYDEPNDKYVALKSGAEFGLEWTSVGSAVEHGPDFRFGGKRIIRASGVNAGTIDNWTLTDFTA